MDGKKYVSLACQVQEPYMPSKCDLPMPGDVHFRYISFQSHKSRFLRVSVSVEMLSETGSRNLLGKDSCRPLHLPVGDAAIARGTAVGSGPDSSQNLSLTSHQQPPLGPRPRPLKHKSQETVPILWGPPRKPPASLAYTTGSVGTTGHQEHTCLGRRGLFCCLHPC